MKTYLNVCLLYCDIDCLFLLVSNSEHHAVRMLKCNTAMVFTDKILSQ